MFCGTRTGTFLGERPLRLAKRPLRLGPSAFIFSKGRLVSLQLSSLFCQLMLRTKSIHLAAAEELRCGGSRRDFGGDVQYLASRRQGFKQLPEPGLPTGQILRRVDLVRTLAMERRFYRAASGSSLDARCEIGPELQHHAADERLGGLG